MLLREIMKGPGDYWPGDENNPRSPDYNPRPPRPRGGGGRDRDELTAHDYAEDRMMRGVQKSIQAREAAISYQKKSGTTHDGKEYNLIVKHAGDASGWMSRKWEDLNFNIYTKVVGHAKDADGNSYLYVNATPQSLVWNAVANSQR